MDQLQKGMQDGESEVSDCVTTMPCSYHQFDIEVNRRVFGSQSNDPSSS
jgi:hypothetical protein